MQTKMKKRMVVLMMFVMATLVVTLVNPRVATVKAASTSCAWDFEATVRQGPDSGTALAGKLSVSIADDGSLTGSLATKDNKTIKVVGQVTGRAVSLAFEIAHMTDKVAGQYIFGTGSAWNQIAPDHSCGGVMGGTFAGPQVGDTGDWGTCYGIHTSSGTCYGVYVD